MVTIAIDTATPAAYNRLQLGMNILDANSPKMVGAGKAAYQQWARDIPVKMVRLWIGRNSTVTHPCTSWNSTTHTGVFNWASFDSLIAEIIAMGATPLIVMCLPRSSSPWWYLPSGMATNSDGSPSSAEDFGEYCKAVAAHYKAAYPATSFYWNTLNEAYVYAGWPPTTAKRLKCMQLHEAAWTHIHEADPGAKVSLDASTLVSWLDFILASYHIDYIDFHHYPGGSMGASTSSIMDTNSKIAYFGSSSYLSIASARAKFLAKYGTDPEVINSETNWSYIYSSGSDPRNITTVGACYDAMTIIWAMYLKMNYRLHFQYSSKESTSHPGTYGFGMIDDTLAIGTAFYPWFVYNWVGQNLAVGDTLYTVTPSPLSSPSGNQVYAAAWRNGVRSHVLVVNKGSTSQTVSITGLTGIANWWQIDPSIPATSAGMSAGLGALVTVPFTLPGYSVRHIYVEDAAPPAPSTLTFSVQDVAHAPLLGATLHVNGVYLTTDAAGAADIDLPDGNYSYECTLEGYIQETGTAHVAGDVTEEVHMAAEPPPPPPEYDLTVTVVDADSDAALVSAIVTLGTIVQATDASGVTVITEEVGSYAFTVAKEGYVSHSSTRSISADAAITIALTPVYVEPPTPTGTPEETLGMLKGVYIGASQVTNALSCRIYDVHNVTPMVDMSMKPPKGWSQKHKSHVAVIRTLGRSLVLDAYISEAGDSRIIGHLSAAYGYGSNTYSFDLYNLRIRGVEYAFEDRQDVVFVYTLSAASLAYQRWAADYGFEVITEGVFEFEDGFERGIWEW